MTKIIQLFIILLISTSCKIQGGAAPIGNNGDRGPNGDRGGNCSGFDKCLPRANWLFEFRSLMPDNLKLIVNGIIVKDECRNGDTGAAIVDRDNNTVKILDYHKPQGSSEIRVIDQGSNCLGKVQWMQRLMPTKRTIGGTYYEAFFFLKY